MSEFLHDPRTLAPPQSFRMGDLLHEMQEIELRNAHHSPVKGTFFFIRPKSACNRLALRTAEMLQLENPLPPTTVAQWFKLLVIRFF